MSGYKNLKYLADIKGQINKEQIYKVFRYVGLDPDDKKTRWQVFPWNEAKIRNSSSHNGGSRDTIIG